MLCSIEGCDKPLDREGLCYRHRLLTVGFSGLARFQADREIGLTQIGRLKETEANAKKDGKDIMIKRGQRGSHEVYADGGWKKV